MKITESHAVTVTVDGSDLVALLALLETSNMDEALAMCKGKYRQANMEKGEMFGLYSTLVARLQRVVP